MQVHGHCDCVVFELAVTCTALFRKQCDTALPKAKGKRVWRVAHGVVSLGLSRRRRARGNKFTPDFNSTLPPHYYITSDSSCGGCRRSLVRVRYRARAARALLGQERRCCLRRRMGTVKVGVAVRRGRLLGVRQ
eukprot:scaffold36097_cov73-Phaeocystis_antarctica.AAC.3